MKIKYSTRLVLLIGNIVIKIPISRRGFLQCKNEKKMWNKYRNLNLLGDLYWECCGIVCMKRYETTPQIDDYMVYGMKHLIKEFDIVRCDLFNPQNWGKDGEIYKLIDYGINEEISKMY